MKPIKGYENYLISECGTKVLNTKTNRYLSIVNRSKNANSYKAISLSKDKIKTMISVHRLVAETYIPNLLNKPQVNHIDGNKWNNHVINLEWVTQSENNSHAYKTGLKIYTEKQRNETIERNKKRIGILHPNSKKVINLITQKVFESVTDASISINISKRDLSRRLRGHVKNNTNMEYYKIS
jgi:hypothetical protein